MKKLEAAKLFGGTQSALARALNLTRSRISQWPDDLDQAKIDRVIGAAIRLGKLPATNAKRITSCLPPAQEANAA